MFTPTAARSNNSDKVSATVIESGDIKMARLDGHSVFLISWRILC